MFPIRTALAGALLLAAGSAAAAPVIDFDIAGAPTSSVTASVTPTACFGCSVSTTLNPALDAQVFALEAGQSQTFSFFDIRVRGVGAASVNVSATLGFDLPTGETASGTGTGGYLTLFGLVSAGTLTWTDPAPVFLPDGSSFLVDLSDILAFGAGNRATVTATITAVDVVAVPEPASLAVFGVGLFGLALAPAQERLMRPNPATSRRGFSSLGASEVGEGAIATSDHVMTPEPTMLGCG